MQLVQKWNGKDYYYLGKGKEDGAYYFLEDISFDCDWYWGINYLEGFKHQKLSLNNDIESHQHFMSNSFDRSIPWYDWTLKGLDSPLSEKAIWKIMEICKSMNILREFADLSYRGGAHISENPGRKMLQNKDYYEMANNKIVELWNLVKDIYQKEQEDLDNND